MNSEETTDGVSALEEMIVALDKSDDRRKMQALQCAIWVCRLAKWDAFGTHTFVGEWSAGHASKAFEKWCKRWLRGRAVYYVVEEHPGGHGSHVHALLSTMGARRDVLWRTWFNTFGRARIEPVRSQKDVAAYCNKFVLGYEVTKQWKSGAWWNVLNCNRKETLPDLQIPVAK